MKKKIGVYKITNTINGKLYIGSSIDLKKREYAHFYNLRNNTHDSKYMQNVFNKFGENILIFSIIEYVENVDILLDREQYWIDYYNVCDRRYGYNTCPTAGNRLGCLTSDETKVKLSKINMGKKLSDEHKMKIKKGNMGKKVSNESRKKMSIAKIGTKVSEETKAKKRANSKDKVAVKNVTTGMIFDSLANAGRYYNVASRSICTCCKGRQKTAGGYKWMYIDK